MPPTLVATRSMRFLIDESQKKGKLHIAYRGLRAHCGQVRNWTRRDTHAEGAELPPNVCVTCRKSAKGKRWVGPSPKED